MPLQVMQAHSSMTCTADRSWDTQQGAEQPYWGQAVHAGQEAVQGLHSRDAEHRAILHMTASHECCYISGRPAMLRFCAVLQP